MILNILGVLAWFGLSFFSGLFIIRWNKKYLLADDINPKKLFIADKINANLNLKRSSIRVWIIILTLWPTSVPKALILRIIGGR